MENNSEIDDLDNEVQNIARKFKQRQDILNVDDITLTEKPDPFLQTMKEQTPEEKAMFEERRFFEGQNVNSWAQRLLKQVVQSIKIIGFNTHKIPAITNLSHFMNISFYLRKEKHYQQEILEVDLLLGTLLISSKRNLQAIEVLRNKVQSIYLKQIAAH